jgi:uncharacterized protein (TIGR03083 family)
VTDNAELREMVEDEQAEFVAMLGPLTPGQWSTPSLCRGWSVKDVVIHIANHTHTGDLQRVAQVARAGLSVTRQLARERSRSTDDLVEWLASPAVLSRPANMKTQLAELLIHQQDIRRPLGLVRQIPAHRLLPLLDRALTRVGSASVAFSRRRAKGLRLVATDMAWTAGEGPEVRGPGEALFMALNGRGNAVQQLSGDGTILLARRTRR